MIWVLGTAASSRIRPPSVPCSWSSATRPRSSRAPGRRWSKLSSTITSVPPAIGTAPGLAAFAASAAASVAGRRNSTVDVLSGLLRQEVHTLECGRDHGKTPERRVNLRPRFVLSDNPLIADAERPPHEVRVSYGGLWSRGCYAGSNSR